MLSAELTLLDRERTSIGLLWLVHLTGIVGISIGFENWFITKTPLNLLLAFVILIINYPINNYRKSFLAAAFFAVGMLAEWLGVHYGLLFGTYSYGENLGPKLYGVPLLIGINWSLLVIITGTIANALTGSVFLRSVLGAGMMVLLDLFLEHSAPRFDFWTFAGGLAPLQNYLAWFIIALILQLLFQAFKMKGNFRIALHLYLAQLLFFFFFFW
jgi:putative membrane protein